MKISPLAGKPAPKNILINIPKLITAYYSNKPDPENKNERISFGTSGHRGSSFTNSFNENHILCITQAICDYRIKNTGPLFLGFDTHALSQPAFVTAMEVLVANKVNVMIAANDEYTPTPVISHAILNYNKGKNSGFADGIIITPSHNPPDDGGFKYNPINGGPAGSDITNLIEKRANELLSSGLKNVKRISFEKAIKSSSTTRFNFLNNYINCLGDVVDMELIKNSGLRIGVDPLGGAGVHFWQPIADKYKINLNVVNDIVDPTFSFMTVDWDGQIRMDPSSPYAMQKLIALKDKFDISFACDTDHDRHGIVTKSSGLLNSNHYLTAAVYYLLQNRPQWPLSAAVGKTVVTTELINRVCEKLGRQTYEVPVGFKYFAEGLLTGKLCFGGEESAGASFSAKNGNVWTTDKDGFIPALLAAEITAKVGKDPGELYTEITAKFGNPCYNRIEAKATVAQKEKLKKLSPDDIKGNKLAGDKIKSIQINAPGNNEPIGGVKVVSENGWFAARPSGTEDIYKIYAESFLSKDNLERITQEAQTIVDSALQMT